MKLNSKKYPDYKNTDIEWMGEVPKHWEIDRLKWATELPVNGTWGSEANNDEYDTLCIRVADFDRQRLIVDRQNEKTYREIEEKDLKSRSLETGDLLLEKSGGGEKQLVGAVIQYDLDERAVCSNFVARMRPRENFDSRFLTYLYDHLYSGKVNYCSIKQTTGIQNLDSQAYLDEKVAYPPLPEQKAIATFLDPQTTRIDQLIEKKKRVLDLLDEQRQATITRAVTKGINPNAKKKDSGIEWLGEVPEHWDLNRLKFYTQINPVKSEVSHLPEDFEVTFTPMEAVKEFGGLDTKEIKTIGDVYTGYTYFKEGDVLTAKITPCFENGKAAIAKDLKNGIGFGTTELHVLRPNSNLINKFLFYMIISEPFLKVGESEMLGAGGQKRVRQEFLEDWIWGFPSVDEQKEIIDFIEEQSLKIDYLKRKIAKAIDHLEEYRSSLITQAVTGKIDVRNEVSEQTLSYAAEEGEAYTTN